MSPSFTVEGLENLQRIFEQYPEKGYRGPVLAGFRKAVQPVKRAMISAIPSNLQGLRKLIKAVVYKRGDPGAAVGVFSRGLVYRNRRGVDWNPWQLVLWHNYGTLDWRANRFHQFTTPLRIKTRGDRKVGIRPQLFIERGWEKSKFRAQAEFEKTVETESIKFLERNAYK